MENITGIKRGKNLKMIDQTVKMYYRKLRVDNGFAVSYQYKTKEETMIKF